MVSGTNELFLFFHLVDHIVMLFHSVINGIRRTFFFMYDTLEVMPTPLREKKIPLLYPFQLKHPTQCYVETNKLISNPTSIS